MSRGRLRETLIAAGILGYALLEHLSNRPTAPAAWGALIAIGPPWLALLALAWRSPARTLALAACLAVPGLLLVREWPLLERHVAPLYLAQQCGLYLTLALVFGRSLLPGQEALCTRWARRVHGELPAHALRYTRAVTAAWTLFFVLIVALSVTLYATASRMVWSLFDNILVLPLLAALFAAEHALRRWRLPDLPHLSPADTLRICLRDWRADSRP